MIKTSMLALLVLLSGCAMTREVAVTISGKGIKSIYANGDATVLLRTKTCVSLLGGSCNVTLPLDI